jgi:hypothetical protein
MPQFTDRLRQWLRSDYLNVESPELRSASFRIQSIRLPGRGSPTLASWTCTPLRAGFSLALDLWKPVPGVVGEVDLAALALDLLTVRTFYDNLTEDQERKDRVPAHLFRARGNVVGRTVDRSPQVGYLAEAGRDIRIWTYAQTSLSFEVRPYCEGTSPRFRLGVAEKMLTWVPAQGGAHSHGADRPRRPRRLHA